MPFLTPKLISGLAGAMAVSAAAVGLEDLVPAPWRHTNDMPGVRRAVVMPVACVVRLYPARDPQRSFR